MSAIWAPSPGFFSPSIPGADPCRCTPHSLPHHRRGLGWGRTLGQAQEELFSARTGGHGALSGQVLGLLARS